VQNCFYQEKEAQEALHKANVVLYAIDLRGLRTAGPDATTSLKDLGCTTGPRCDPNVLLSNARGITQNSLQAIDGEPQILWDMAERAGGRAILDNDILGALRAPFLDSSAAYALGFYPETPKLDGNYHRLEVKVSGRADLTVRYRRGYVNESSDPEEQFRTALWSPIDSSAIALTAEIGETFEVKLC
jgi:VWFA-related protein